MRGLLVLLIACAAPAAPHGSPLEVKTDRGMVVGQFEDGVRAFLGIPYATAPRWRPPGEVAAWSAPRDASHYGLACPQVEAGYHRDTGEECLNLNVWVPPGDHLPVMLWIHGGAFIGGAGSDDLYVGANLAKRARAIVVTINYRLGPLGWASNRALAAEQGVAALPAFGLLDQRAAMRWVQRNIAAFGGDPAQVTIFGESAGGWSVCAQLAMPGSRGLFARAIIMSGACADALVFSADQANAQGDQLAAKVGCTSGDVAACLRGKPADEIAAALPFRRGMLLPPGVWWGPIVDGRELPKVPLAAIRAGELARVPLMIGTARDEGTLHVSGYKEVTAGELAWFVGDVFGERAAAPVVARYQRPTPKDALRDIVTDGIFACNTRRAARLVAARGVPVYLYEWTHALDGPPFAHALGPTHGVDEFFLFGVTAEGIGPSPREQPLVELTQDAWGKFAHGGEPWPRYDGSRYQILDLQPAIGEHWKDDVCDFWDSLL
ncbi:MAG: carboxylesterase/lipase family protein [Acidobacteriota bacterium]